MAEHGVTFDETMAGPFALGASDPHKGATRGTAEDTQLTMNASVVIDNLDDFTADPDHAGALSGTVDFAPLGIGLTADDGVFNLFSPADTAETRNMIYELAFQHDGRPLYLAGRKVVHHDSSFDLWTDTTTLFTTLYEGSDKSGVVIGAGVLSLDVMELVKLVSTMRVTGTNDPILKSRALAKFGQFFMGELWDRYGPNLR